MAAARRRECATSCNPAVRPENRLRLGSALADMSRAIGLTNADVEALEQARDPNAAEPLRFE